MVRIDTSPVSNDQQENKFQELILYIAAKCQSDPEFGKTRLYKALFYADWNSYIETGETITGHTYVKGPHGPMPHEGDRILGDLEERRQLATQKRNRGGLPQRQPIALRDANLDLFTASEIAIVDRVIEDQWGMTATGVSKQSHREIHAWEIARDGERIPFSTSWIAPRSLTHDEIEYGMQLVLRS